MAKMLNRITGGAGGTYASILVTGLDGPSGHGLPSGFQEVEYIQSSGTQYIDTTFVPSANDIARYYFNGEIYPTTYDTDWYFGCSDSNYFGAYISSTWKLMFLNGSNRATTISSPQSSWSSIDVLFEDIETATLEVNDTTYTIAHSERSNRPSLSVYLCGRHTSTGGSSLSTIKIKEFKISHTADIWDHDFIPCYCTESKTAYQGETQTTAPSGTIGLYDLVDGKFYINSGSDTFEKGDDVSTGSTVTAETPSGETKTAEWISETEINPEWKNLPSDYTQVEYIQSDGSQYIDTNISLGSDDFEINAKINNVSTSSYEQALFSIWTSSPNYWNLYISSSRELRLYVNANYVVMSSIQTGTDYDVSVTRTGSSWIATCGSSSVTATYSPSTVNNTTVKIFTRGDVPSTSSSDTREKVYSITITKGSSVVFNGVPCLNTSTSKYGMYDLISKTFFGNLTSGTDFTAGEEIPQYITTEGYKFSKLDEYGTYSITATDGTQTATKDVLVDMATDYEIEMSYSLNFQYIKWNITGIYGSGSAIQAAEFKLIDNNGDEYTWNGESITCNLSSTYSFEDIVYLIDNSTSTKFLSYNWSSVCTIIINMGDTYTLSDFPKYAYYVANDAQARDPVTWTVSISEDGETYTTVSTVSNYSTPSTRSVIAGTWTMSEE